MKRIISIALIIMTSVFLLAGCGGTGDDQSEARDFDFFGVAAIGAPAAGYTVYFRSADGHTVEAVAQVDGSYRISAKNVQAPFTLWFELANGENIYAVTFQDGIVNLNAITSAIARAAFALSGSSDEMDATVLKEADIQTAESAVSNFMQPILELYGVDLQSFDPQGMPDFATDGFGVDGILDDFEINYDDSAQEVVVKKKGNDIPLGSLAVENVKNNEDNSDDIESGELADVNISMVEKVAGSITFTAIADDNTSANNVIEDLDLFTEYKNGTSVSWVVSDETVVSLEGDVTRPAVDTEVTLTATVTKGGVSFSKSLTVIVKAADGNDSGDVGDGGDSGDSGDSDDGSDSGDGGDAGDGGDTGDGGDSGDGGDAGGVVLGELTLEDVLGNNRSADSVIFNMNLMAELEDGTAVSWESSDPEYIDAEGNLLKRPLPSEGTKTVTLSSERTKETLSAEDSFTVTIPSIVPETMDYGVLIKEDGSLWYVSYPSRYPVGESNFEHHEFVQEVSSSYDWVSVAGNTDYTLAIKSDGTLWGWGYNYSKQVNGSEDEVIYTPVQIGTDSDWVNVAVGKYMDVSAAIKADGTLWVWGSTDYGMVPAEEGVQNVSAPVQELSLGSDWVDVKVGYPYITGLKSDGTVWSWGMNYYAGFGTAASADPVSTPVQESSKSTDWVAIDAYGATSAVKSDGTLWYWGGMSFDLATAEKSRSLPDEISGRGGPSFYPVESPTQEPSLSTNWVKPMSTITIGGLKSDGTIWSFGEGGSYAFGNGVAEDSLEMVQEATQSTDWIDVKNLGVSVYAKKADGSLWGWGYNREGELGTGYGNIRIYEPTLYTKKKFVKAEGVYGSSCGIDENEDLWCTNWDLKVFTQVPGKWRDIILDGSAFWGIKTDGTLWFWGRDNEGYFTGVEGGAVYDEPVQIGSDTWKQIDIQRHDGSANFAFGIQTDGTLWAMGSGAYYDGTNWITAYGPVQVDTGEWSKVITGHNRLAIKSDGTLWTWNAGWSSGLGGVYPSADEFPVQVGTATWKDVKVSRGYYGIGIQTDGTLWGWGYSVHEMLFDSGGHNDYLTPTAMSSTDTDWEKVSVSYGVYSALKSDGSLYTAGNIQDYPNYMQGLGNDTGSINTFRKVSGSYSDVFFMKDMVMGVGTDGEIYVWGRNTFEYVEPVPIKIID